MGILGHFDEIPSLLGGAEGMTSFELTLEADLRGGLFTPAKIT